MENSIGRKSPPSQKRTAPQQQWVDARFFPYRSGEPQTRFLLCSCAVTASPSPTIRISPFSSTQKNGPKTLQDGAYDSIVSRALPYSPSSGKTPPSAPP